MIAYFYGVLYDILIVLYCICGDCLITSLIVFTSVFNYQIPALIVDVLFLAWVYYALGSTIRILTEFQQV